MKPVFCVLAATLMTVSAWGQFRFRDVDSKSLELSDGGAPVFVFNHGTMLPTGVPADRARCCYVHPVYTPNGTVVSDDFPKDHYHHRGISWMWPIVTVDGKTYDGWMLKGLAPKFEKWTTREAGADRAVLAFVDGWYVGDRKVVEEQIEIVALPVVGGARNLDFTLKFQPVNGADVTIAGTHEGNKGYGGFNLRFAPRTGTKIATGSGGDVPDSDMQPYPWAELSGDFGGRPASARIAIDPSNPSAPNGWCLRHYGFLGVNYPGLATYKLDPKQPLVLKFRVTLADAATRKVLVYTRNGKGYVHDNIADSVKAIRKMGAENGFAVDASDDPTVFTDATLKQYKAIVFSNSNNEAFLTDAQRDAFKRYVQAGGGIVGIHSASGSERTWPYFWSLMGGKFLYHPRMQPFEIRVTDPSHLSAKGMPATFEWEDECYHLEFLNPDLHPILVTDPSKLDDKDRGKHPFGLVGNTLPLAWTLHTDGGRQFYTSLGHKKEDYAKPTLYNHILGGILWAMGEGN